ncbi:MAG: GAF domain-containing protein [Cyanobacteria bacterium P01_F01_bin.150]
MQRLTKQQGCTIVLVTHDNRILDIADRIISLEDGRLSQTEGEFLLNINNLMSAILQMETSQIRILIDPFSTDPFSTFLKQLNQEFDQMLNTVNLLKDDSVNRKLNLIMKAVSIKISQLLAAERVTLFVVDRERYKLWSQNACGTYGEPINIEIPLDSGIAGYVATTGKSLNISDPYSDSRFNVQVDKNTGFVTRNILALPILDSQASEVVAVVELINKMGEMAFDSDDEARLLDFIYELGSVFQTNIQCMRRAYELID